MITLRSIKMALTARLKTAYPSYKVHFDNVDKSDAPYFHVELTPSVTTIDGVYSDRTITVDITLLLPEDAYGRIDRMQLYDVSDTLDKTIRPVFRVEDRAITILSARTVIVDDILHYLFDLDFCDALTDEEAGRVQYELMQQLHLRLNEDEQTEEE